MYGETMVFFTDEDFADNDVARACTVEFGTTSFGAAEWDAWLVRVADYGSPTERPVIDEDPETNGQRAFDTEKEAVEWMAKFGFRRV